MLKIVIFGNAFLALTLTAFLVMLLRSNPASYGYKEGEAIDKHVIRGILPANAATFCWTVIACWRVLRLCRKEVPDDRRQQICSSGGQD